MISRVNLARGLAIAADALQLGLFPLVAEGWISPVDIGLDVVMCVVLTWMVGWHIAFLPSFLLKGVPFIDLAPTWTIAVLIATRKRDPQTPQPGASGPIIDVPSSAVPPRIADNAGETKIVGTDTGAQRSTRGAVAADWPRAIMWISIVAIIAGSTMYMFRSCAQAPSRFANDLTDHVSNAAREFAAAFVKGTVTTQFREYCTEIQPSLSLQVATLKEVEQFTRSDEAVIGNIPLPEVIVSVTAPVEYVYCLNLNEKWDFDLRGNVLTVRVPELRANKPSFDVSNMKWDIQKDSLIRNTTRVKEELRQSLMPLAASRGRAHVKLVRETARTQVSAFVEKWLRDRFKDGGNYRVQVYFESEPKAPGVVQ